MSPRFTYDAAAHGALPRWLSGLPAGAHVTLPAGRFDGPLEIDRDLRLTGAGAGATVLAGARRCPAVSVTGGAASVRLTDLALEGGDALRGGGLQVHGDAEVALDRCRVRANRARRAGGGAYVVEGVLLLHDCRLEQNRAPEGAALFVGLNGQAIVVRSLIALNEGKAGAAAAVRANGVVRLLDSRASLNPSAEGEAALDLRGTRAHAPILELRGGALGGASPLARIAAAPGGPMPVLRVRAASVPRELLALPGVIDLGDNTLG